MTENAFRGVVTFCLVFQCLMLPWWMVIARQCVGCLEELVSLARENESREDYKFKHPYGPMSGPLDETWRRL